MLASATELALDGATIAIPSLSHQLVHLVAHGLLQHAQLESGRFLLRDLAEQALLTERAGRDDLWAARERFVAAGHGACLGGCRPPQHASAFSPVRSQSARRRVCSRHGCCCSSARAGPMQSLGPAGWLAARLAGVATAGPTLGSLPSLARQLQLFRSKTMW